MTFMCDQQNLFARQLDIGLYPGAMVHGCRDVMSGHKTPVYLQCIKKFPSLETDYNGPVLYFFTLLFVDLAGLKVIT